MKEKYQNWVKAIRNVAKPVYTDGTMSIVVAEKTANEAADFLQSLADMPDEKEPDEDVIIGTTLRTDIVTKANRDYWMKRCINTLQLTSKIDSLSRELATKDARITELQNIIRIITIQPGEQIKLTQPLDVRDFGAIADQPKRPILADQSEVFNELRDALWAACMGNENILSDRIIALEKLLVGE